MTRKDRLTLQLPQPAASVDHVAWGEAVPWPHTVIDGVLPIENAMFVAEQDIQSIDGAYWHDYNTHLEVKKACNDLTVFSLPILMLLTVTLRDPGFLTWLEKWTGIEGLIPDPYLRGAGIHRTDPGGFLDIHLDSNYHPRLRLYRRVSVFIYLSAPEGGDLELWEGEKDAGRWRAYANKRIKTIPVTPGQMVILECSDRAYNGHPEIVTDGTRISLAAYYYTAAPGPHQEPTPRSTLYAKRPAEPNEGEKISERARRVSQSRDGWGFFGGGCNRLQEEETPTSQEECFAGLGYERPDCEMTVMGASGEDTEG